MCVCIFDYVCQTLRVCACVSEREREREQEEREKRQRQTVSPTHPDFLKTLGDRHMKRALSPPQKSPRFPPHTCNASERLSVPDTWVRKIFAALCRKLNVPSPSLHVSNLSHVSNFHLWERVRGWMCEWEERGCVCVSVCERDNRSIVS